MGLVVVLREAGRCHAGVVRHLARGPTLRPVITHAHAITHTGVLRDYFSRYGEVEDVVRGEGGREPLACPLLPLLLPMVQHIGHHPCTMLAASNRHRHQPQVVMKDRVTRLPRGFGFLRFKDPGAAAAAVAEGPHYLDDRWGSSSNRTSSNIACQKACMACSGIRAAPHPALQRELCSLQGATAARRPAAMRACASASLCACRLRCHAPPPPPPSIVIRRPIDCKYSVPQNQGAAAAAVRAKKVFVGGLAPETSQGARAQAPV